MKDFEAVGYMKAVVGENDFYMFINEQPQGGFKWTFLDFKPEDDYNYRPIYIRLKPADEAIDYWKQKYIEARVSGYEEGKEECGKDLKRLSDENARLRSALDLIASKERDEENWTREQLITALRYCEHEARTALDDGKTP